MLRKVLKVIKGGRDNVAPVAAGIETLLEDAAPSHASGAATLQRFLGRQPVLDAGYRIAGYELKMKSTAPLPAMMEADALQQVRDEMLVVGVIDLAFQKALGNKLTFLSVSPAMLSNSLIDELPARNVVVAVSGITGAMESLVERCGELAARGIQIALEDPPCQPGIEPLLKLCRYVRIDTSRRDALKLGEYAAEILKSSSPQLIAKQVETEEAFEAYRKLPFDLFQGYYFTRLQPAAPQRLDNNRLRVMELLNMVSSRADIPALEEKVKLDAALSYKLLNFINSPANGLNQKIRSIGHALTLLGYDQLYRWLTLLMFTAGEPDERSRALLKNALVRGRFIETLGQGKVQQADLGGLFIVGIFSLLDALLNVPMEQALARLNLPQPVVAALARRDGFYAPYLQLAIACENFDQDTIARYSAACGLDADEVNLAHVNALIWAEQIES